MGKAFAEGFAQGGPFALVLGVLLIFMAAAARTLWKSVWPWAKGMAEGWVTNQREDAERRRLDTKEAFEQLGDRHQAQMADQNKVHATAWKDSGSQRRKETESLTRRLDKITEAGDGISGKLDEIHDDVKKAIKGKRVAGRLDTSDNGEDAA